MEIEQSVDSSTIDFVNTDKAVLPTEKDINVSVKNLFDFITSEEDIKFLANRGINEFKDIQKFVKSFRDLNAQFTKVSKGKIDEYLSNPIIEDLVKDKLGLNTISNDELNELSLDIADSESLHNISDESRESILKNYNDAQNNLKNDLKELNLTKKQAENVLNIFKTNFIKTLDKEIQTNNNIEKEVEELEAEWGIEKDNNFQKIKQIIRKNKELTELSMRYPKITQDSNFLKFIYSLNKDTETRAIPFTKDIRDTNPSVDKYTEIGLQIIERMHNKNNFSKGNYLKS